MPLQVAHTPPAPIGAADAAALPPVGVQMTVAPASPLACLALCAQDLLNAQTAAEVMEFLELTARKDRWIHVEGCSAKTGDGLETGLQKLLAKVQPAAAP